jgi:NitT/TauT family transport system substrate-binding protein
MLSLAKIVFAALVGAVLFGAPLASAQDKVRVAVFPSLSALPFFVARDRGFFKEVGIEAEGINFQTHPLILQALIAGDIDAASNFVTLEGANGFALKPGVVRFVSVNAQNVKYRGEVFVVRTGFSAGSIKDLKGAKIMSAPGPANMSAARAVLKANGLVEGKDFTFSEQQMGMHLPALKAGTFDAAYTLEPLASMMVNEGVARILEDGVIAKYIVGRPEGFVAAAGGALSGKFLTERPDVAKRFVAAWRKAIDTTWKDPSVRDYLSKYMNTPAAVAPTVPFVKFTMSSDLSDADMADMQKFIDFAVDSGVVRSKVDVKQLLLTM